MTIALLIVDMQNALLPFVWEGPSLVRRLSAVIARTHASGTLVVVTIQSGASGSPLELGGEGAQPARELGLRTDDVRVVKTATDSFYRSELLQVLTHHEVTALTVGGIATEYCVDATVRSALSHGFDVNLLSNGHSPTTGAAAHSQLSPQQVRDHHNEILTRAVHPGGVVRLVPSGEAFQP